MDPEDLGLGIDNDDGFDGCEDDPAAPIPF